MYGYLSTKTITKIQTLADKALFIERDEISLFNCKDELEKIIGNIDTTTLTGYSGTGSGPYGANHHQSLAFAQGKPGGLFPERLSSLRPEVMSQHHHLQPKR